MFKRRRKKTKKKLYSVSVSSWSKLIGILILFLHMKHSYLTTNFYLLMVFWLDIKKEEKKITYWGHKRLKVIIFSNKCYTEWREEKKRAKEKKRKEENNMTKHFTANNESKAGKRMKKEQKRMKRKGKERPEVTQLVNWHCHLVVSLYPFSFHLFLASFFFHVHCVAPVDRSFLKFILRKEAIINSNKHQLNHKLVHLVLLTSPTEST